ncbi:SAV_915 family protein [Micromonospora sp. WMMD737]|uniref:SAV_915 family protein n=1 Tax=Micromonospora sp. WMMD737 TaxID=3404113 RepID=UPI003B9586C2
MAGRQALTVRTARLPDGQRVGLAFSSSQQLAGAMGPEQEWTLLCESALRTMLRPLGITRIQVDPLLVTRPITLDTRRFRVVEPARLGGVRSDASRSVPSIAALAGTLQA